MFKVGDIIRHKYFNGSEQLIAKVIAETGSSVLIQKISSPPNGYAWHKATHIDSYYKDVMAMLPPLAERENIYYFVSPNDSSLELYPKKKILVKDLVD